MNSIGNTVIMTLISAIPIIIIISDTTTKTATSNFKMEGSALYVIFAFVTSSQTAATLANKWVAILNYRNLISFREMVLNI
jgi:hypothetical protein